jgi:polyhydroxyalkanoate synthesis regulator phasin
MRTSICYVAVLSAWAACVTAQTVTKYSTFVEESDLGTNFGISLLDKTGKQMKSIKMVRGENSTTTAIAALGPDDNNYKTIGVLLDESAGGRCDACRTTVEHLIVTMMELVRSNGQFSRSAPESGTHIKVSVPPEEATKAVNAMCTSAKFAKYAPHVMKGCVEFLASNGTEMVEKLNGAMQGEKFERLLDDICSGMIGVCKNRGKLPETISKCRSCAEVVSVFDYNLRRANPVADDSDGLSDAMSLNKRKKVKDLSYMSRLYVEKRLAELCGQSLQHTLLAGQTISQALNEECEDLLDQYEEDIVRAFTKKKPMFDAGREICVDVASSCSENEYDELAEQLLTGIHLVPFGPMDITITARSDRSASGFKQLSPREKAMLAAKKEAEIDSAVKARTGRATTKTAKPTKTTADATPPKAKAAAMSPEEEVEALQDFIDEMESKGEISSDEAEAFLRKAFNADKALLRCYRMNRNKPAQKLLARMRLLTASAAKAEKVEAPAKKAKLSAEEERMQRLTEKMKEVHRTGSPSSADVEKLGDTMSQLRSQMQAQGMDTATMDKLDGLLKSTKKMSSSHRSREKDDSVSAAEQAAEAAMEAANVLREGDATQAIPEVLRAADKFAGEEKVPDKEEL